MKLSKNFWLNEFLVSQTATRFGIDMTPTDQIISNIQLLVRICLQPLRDELGSAILITSGYRPLELNTRIGGSKTSQHIHGRAVDFHSNKYTPLEICEIAERMELPFDQLIHEFGRWVHLGIAPVNRGETLTAWKRKGRTIYTPGLHSIADLEREDGDTI